MTSAVSVGAAPVTGSTPPLAAHVITQLSRATFVGGMHAAFLVGAALALAGAIIALIIRQGTAPPKPTPTSDRQLRIEEGHHVRTNKRRFERFFEEWMT